jgi:hypothetical protein
MFIGFAKDGSLMTKGENNPTPDDSGIPLTANQVLGKEVFMLPTFVPYFGLNIQARLLVLIGLLVVAGLIILGVVYVKGNKKLPSEKTVSPMLTSNPV